MKIRKFYHPTIDLAQKIDGGPEFGTDYDLSDACPDCGAGAMPIGVRLLKNIPASTKALVRTYENEIIVNNEVSKALQSIEVSSLTDIQNTQGKIQPFKELRQEAILPPFSAKTTGYETECQCPTCKRNGYFNLPKEPLQLVYESLDPSYFDKHILGTHEIFGITRRNKVLKKCGFHCPLYVLSETVVDALQQFNLKYLSFEPVTINRSL